VEDSLATLMASMKLSETTKRTYRDKVNLYLDYVKMRPDEFVRSVKANPRKFEQDFVKFIRKTGEKSGPSATSAFRYSLMKFLEINRVMGVNWSYIGEFVPRSKSAGQDRAPTVEEVRKIVDVADLRSKCVVLFLCSSGARIGALPALRWRDIEPVKRDDKEFAKVTVYRGESEEYITFITPECHVFLLRYRELREKVGEKVTDASYVFTTEANKEDFDQRGVRPVSVKTLKNMLGKQLRHLGMRSVISERAGYKSYEFRQAHGFRKFFKTRLEVTGVKSLAIETMMGHSTGVTRSYYKPTTDELAREYVKAIDSLTIAELKTRSNEEETKSTFKKQLLLVAGFKEEEVNKMDLSKTSDEDFQKMVRGKLLGGMENNGNHQKVVPLVEVDSYISEGWDFVAALPDDRAVMKLPS